MADRKPVLVVGAGPVGLVAAAALLRRGVPVTVLEAGAGLAAEMHGSTFHAPTLDMLDDLGASPASIEQGIVAPRMQYRGRGREVIADFDFGILAGEATPLPAAVRAVQAHPHPPRPAA